MAVFSHLSLELWKMFEKCQAGGTFWHADPAARSASFSDHRTRKRFFSKLCVAPGFNPAFFSLIGGSYHWKPANIYLVEKIKSARLFITMKVCCWKTTCNVFGCKTATPRKNTNNKLTPKQRKRTPFMYQASHNSKASIPHRPADWCFLTPIVLEQRIHHPQTTSFVLYKGNGKLRLVIGLPQGTLQRTSH